ncbi:MAG: hypothetical protein ABGY71_15375 [bacterium]|jgi:tRNA nucleotidyltransferase/poly(A) polymerase|nr:CCA tRNA nucleotidyltransferase [Planctomycetota bacterium]HIL51114.1 CCA tRNA nucleotidyltransferase [Planctomycetota bacterium]
MDQPSVQNLSADLRAASRSIAETLKAAGHQAWIVGGAVRDLARGAAPREVDMATDALPDSIEALFPRTSCVGKAFGTIVVHQELDGKSIDVEVTTFRSDGAYGDCRRPKEVTYGTSVEEDARRRDFTSNALYLGPLTDEFLDPERGLADIAAGRLQCVGEAAQRFGEDGLRLLRLARFAAKLNARPTREVLAAAAATRASLKGVSAERIAAELRGIFATERPALALDLLLATGLLEVALGPPDDDEILAQTRQRAFETLSGPLAEGLGLALLLGPEPLQSAATPAHRERLDALRCSRALSREVLAIWQAEADLVEHFEAGARDIAASRRLMRLAAWPAAKAALGAWFLAAEHPHHERLQGLDDLRSTLTESDLWPPALVTSSDLAAAKIPRGPRWSTLFHDAETLQLNGELTTRAAALKWLTKRTGAGE